MNDERGSIWRKWDLHVHTPSSAHHSYGNKNNIWDIFIDKLEAKAREYNINAISMTDYFSLDGYKKVLEYQNDGRLEGILILPNIEFRLDVFVENKRLNYHVIFSNEIPVEKIESEFLESLTIKNPKAEIRQYSVENVEEIGKILKKHQTDFRGESDFEVGIKNITVSIGDIKDKLERKKTLFGGKYLLVLAEPGWADIDWRGQNHLTRKTILVESHALFSSNPKTILWAIGKGDSPPRAFKDEFGSLKPCIWGSDAHDFERLLLPDENRFCWIKADLNFTGLKQIIYEPEARVRIQEENPEPRKSIYTIKSVKITNSDVNEDLKISEGFVHLNPNLVAVTGGKGTGKTALLDLLANCFEDRCKRGRKESEDKNSFVQRVEGEKPDLRIEVRFTGSNVGKFDKELLDEKYFLDSRITYLPQGKIEEYSGDRTKLNMKIKETVFENERVRERDYEEHFSLLNGEISKDSKIIDSLNRSIHELEGETGKEITEEIEKKIKLKEGELKDKKAELAEFEKSIGEDVKKKISTLKRNETKFRIKHSKLVEIEGRLGTLLDELTENKETYNEVINGLNVDLEKIGIEVKVPPIEYSAQISDIRKAIKAVTKDYKNVNKSIGKLTKGLGQLDDIEKTHADMLGGIEKIINEIKAVKIDKKRLQENRKQMKAYEKERRDIYVKLFKRYYELKRYYDEVINVFTEGKSKIMEGVDFVSDVHFDKDRFVELGSDILDHRKINTIDIVRVSELLNNVVGVSGDRIMKESIKDYLAGAFVFKDNIKSTRSTYDFYSWVFLDYFSLDTLIYFNSRPMDKLSMGQKGTVLLKLFLAEGDHPLVIDQPEDSLDNKFIYKELVGAIREAKKDRQIIIATNNANLVVNTDSEQVIVAEYDDNIISYKLGSLENKEIRKDIMPILEGGEEAFRKREEKYGIYGYRI